MKLQTKTILYYLLVSLPLLIVTALISYFLIKRAVNENLNEEMWADKQRAEALIDGLAQPKNMFLSLDSMSTIKADTNGAGHRFTNMISMDRDTEQVEYRALRSFYRSKGKSYLITIVKPKPEEDDLIENLLQTLLITIGFLVFSFFIINWILSKTLWRPFNETMKQISDYDLRNNNVFQFRRTSTKEFNQLNETILKMTDKVKSDFISQKEFTENASHETQTPLAIIKARIDLLMQSPNLKEEEMKQLQVIENAVAKLSALNKALLLLAKIDNKQFGSAEELDFEAVFNKALSIYEEAIEAKRLTVEVKSHSQLKLKMHPVLAEIMLGNLIQNAVRHNMEDGKIFVSTSSNAFSISNTGAVPDFETGKMFGRFSKGSTSKDSLGLGLAIVKRIADNYNMKVEYSFDDGLHKFKIVI